MKRNNHVYRPPVKFTGSLSDRQDREINQLIDIAIKQDGHKKADTTIAGIREAFSGKRFVEVFRSSERGPEEIVVAITIQGDDDPFWFRAYLSKKGAIDYIKRMGLCPDYRSENFLNKVNWR